jgi:hypothetical protein
VTKKGSSVRVIEDGERLLVWGEVNYDYTPKGGKLFKSLDELPIPRVRRRGRRFVALTSRDSEIISSLQTTGVANLLVVVVEEVEEKGEPTVSEIRGEEWYEEEVDDTEVTVFEGLSEDGEE